MKYVVRPKPRELEFVDAIRYKTSEDVGEVVLWLQERAKHVYTGFFHPTSPLATHQWLLIWDWIDAIPDSRDLMTIVKPGDWIAQNKNGNIRVYTHEDFIGQYAQHEGSK